MIVTLYYEDICWVPAHWNIRS